MIAAVAAACALTATTPVAAVPVADAVAVHATDIASAELTTALYNASDTDITCANPTVKGIIVTPNRDTGTVLVRGTDAAAAEGHCVSLTVKSYSITVKVQIERWDESAGEYVAVCPAGSGTAQSVYRTGVAVTPASTLCTYDYSALPPGVRVPLHRAHAILSNSLNGALRHGYSEVAWPAGDSMSVA
ncbi:MAG TPA: hypothetical protein VGX28_02195 [Frankiaceae bacterium]|nr:hypothetical protein [Frankiaceae bacterium]